MNSTVIRISAWDKLFQYSTNNFSEVQFWIHFLVCVEKCFFTHYKGSYEGLNYVCNRPPARLFTNHMSFRPFVPSISYTLIGRLASGAICVWSWVGESPPLHLVMQKSSMEDLLEMY